MKSIFQTDEMSEILSQYDIGEFRDYGEIKKNDDNSFGQAIGTDKGTFFMKVLLRFDVGVAESIHIAHALYIKGFPTYKTCLTRDGYAFVCLGR